MYGWIKCICYYNMVLYLENKITIVIHTTKGHDVCIFIQMYHCLKKIEALQETFVWSLLKYEP